MAESHRDEIAKLEALFSAHPDGRVFTHLAEAYRKSGELDRAREILEEGLSRHAEYPSAHVVLGRVLWDERRLDDAAGAFHRVLELDRQNLVALRALGDLAREAGRREEALGRYRELSTLDPGNEEVEAIIQALEGNDASAAAGAVPENAEGDAAAGEPDPLAGLVEMMPAEPAAAPADPNIDAMAALDDLGFEPTAIEIEPTALVEDVPMAERPPLPDDAAAEDDDAPVVTETMADLYARQGLFDRAAEVYRELLQGRPAADRLAAKLAEVEAQAAAGPGAYADAAAVEPAATPPAEGPFHPALLEARLAEAEPIEAESARTESTEAGPIEIEPVSAGDPAADPWAPEAGPIVSESTQPSQEPAPAAPESSAVEELPLLPELELEPEWEVGAPAGAAAAPAAAGSTGEPTIREYFRALLAWRPAGSSAAPSAPPADVAAPAAARESEEGERKEPEPFAAPGSDEFDLLFATERESAGEAAPGVGADWDQGAAADPLAEAAPEPEPSTGAEEEAEDDNDLEMFRAWLQNLKR